MSENDNIDESYAFIDGQNLHSGVSQLGWKLDHKKFRKYLKDEYQVEKAFIFLGFMEEMQDLYTTLQDCGFILIFKPLIRYHDNTIKGNVDADMVLKTMVEIDNYKSAVIITGDGDFHGLIRHLIQVRKLKKLIIPNKSNSSSLFERISEMDQRKYFIFVDNLKDKLKYGDSRPRKASSATRPRAQGRAQSHRAPEKSSKS